MKALAEPRSSSKKRKKPHPTMLALPSDHKAKPLDSEGNLQAILTQLLLRFNCPPLFFQAVLPHITQLATMLFPLDKIVTILLKSSSGLIIKLSETMQLQVDIPTPTNNNQFIFALTPPDEKSYFSFPHFDVIKSKLGIDLQTYLPSFISDLYQSLSIPFLKYHWSRQQDFKPYIYMPVVIQKLSIFGIEIDSIELFIKVNFAPEHTYIRIAMKILWKGLSLVGELPGCRQDEWKLSGQLKPTSSQKISDFIPNALSHSLPQWLQDQCPSISQISGEFWPRSKRFSFIIDCAGGLELYKVKDTCIALENMKFKLTNFEFKDSDQRPLKKTPLQLSLEGVLQIGGLKSNFSMAIGYSTTFKIEGTIEKKDVSQLYKDILLPLLQLVETGPAFSEIEKLLPADIGTLHYSITPALMQLSTDALSISLLKPRQLGFTAAKDKVIYIDCRLPKGLIPKSYGFLADIDIIDFGFVYCNADVKDYGWTKCSTLTAKIPLHRIPGLCNLIKTELYLPIKLNTHGKKPAISTEDLSLPGELNLGLLTIKKVKIGCTLGGGKKNFVGFNIQGSLSLDLPKTVELEGKLTVNIGNSRMPKIAGTFILRLAAEWLGIVLHGVSVTLQYDGLLSAGLIGDFAIADEDKLALTTSDEEKGKVMASFGASGFKAFRLEFPAGFALSIKGISQMLLSPSERATYSSTVEKLQQLLPVAIGPVSDETFTQALQDSEAKEVAQLLSDSGNRLIVHIDIEELSAQIAGQINVNNLLEAFILLDFSIYNGLTLVGGAKPIELLGGLLKINKSAHSGSRQPPIDVGGPVLYACIPGLNFLSNLEEYKKIRIHANARVEFFNSVMDAYVEISPQGLDICLQTHIDLALLLLDSKLLVIINEKQLCFAVNAQLSLSLPTGHHLIGVRSALSVKIPILSPGDTTIEVSASLSLKVLNIDQSLDFEVRIPQGDCHSFDMLLEEVTQGAVKQILSPEKSLSEQVKKFEPGMLFAEGADDQLTVIGQAFENLLFPLAESKVPALIRKQDSQLCLFHYLLRLNKLQTIQKAILLISTMENRKVTDLLVDIDQTIESAVSMMEQKPFVTFCYLRFLELTLSSKADSSQDPIHLYQKALVQYFLGVLYANGNIPMSIQFRQHYDEKVERHCQQNNYLTDEELLECRIDFFVLSIENFLAYENKIYNLKEKKRKARFALSIDSKNVHEPKPIINEKTIELYLLPLYQLWVNRNHDYVVKTLREHSDLFKKLAPKNISGKETKDILTPILKQELLLATSNELENKDRKELSFEGHLKKKMVIIALFMACKEESIRKDLLLEPNYNCIVKFCNQKYIDQRLTIYQQLAATYLQYEKFQDNGSFRSELEQIKNTFEHIVSTNRKHPYYEPLLDNYFLIYTESSLLYFQGTLEKNLLQRKKYYFTALNKSFIHKRVLMLMPDGTGHTERELSVTTNSITTVHREIAELYEKPKLHLQEITDEKKGIHSLDHSKCEHCQTEARFHTVQFLKSIFVDDHVKIKFYDQIYPVNNSNPPSLITVEKFNEELVKVKLPTPLFNALYTVKKLDIAYEMFITWSITQPEPMIREISAWIAIMLKFSMIRLLLISLEYGYIPAYFQLETFLQNQTPPISRVDEDSLFEEIYRVLINKDTSMSSSTTLNASKKIKKIKDIFKEQQNFIIPFFKRHTPFPGIDKFDQMNMGELTKDILSTELLSAREKKLIANGARPFIEKKIKELYKELSSTQRALFAKTCSKTDMSNFIKDVIPDLVEQTSSQSSHPKGILPKLTALSSGTKENKQTSSLKIPLSTKNSFRVL